jgi:RNA polymerase sigma-70 factor (ECF subfamily)
MSENLALAWMKASRGMQHRIHGRWKSPMKDRTVSLAFAHLGEGDIEPELLHLTKEFLENRLNGTAASSEAVRAWETFYAHYSSIIRESLRCLCLKDPELNDCTQDVWKKLITQLAGFEHDTSRCSFRSWLNVLVRHQAIDLVRRERRWALQSLEEVPASEPSYRPASLDSTPGLAAFVDEMQTALQDLSRRVSPRTYQVLTMRWIQGRSVAETASTLGMTHPQVWTCYHRVRKRLLRLLAQRQSHLP